MPERRNETTQPLAQPAPQAAGGPHALRLRERSELEVSGVIRVISCDESAAVLETPLGNLTIGGQGLQVSELSVQTGQVRLCGNVEFLQYAENHRSSGGLLARLMR